MGGVALCALINGLAFWLHRPLAFWNYTETEVFLLDCGQYGSAVVFAGHNRFFGHALVITFGSRDDAIDFVTSIGRSDFRAITPIDLDREGIIPSYIIPTNDVCHLFLPHQYVSCSKYGFPFDFAGVAWGDVGDGLPVILDTRSFATRSGHIVPMRFNYLTAIVNCLLCSFPVACLILCVKLLVFAHRYSMGKCVRCGYPIAGSSEQVLCPECGLVQTPRRKGICGIQE